MEQWLATLLWPALIWLIAGFATWGVVAVLVRAQREARGRRKPGGLQMFGAILLGIGEPMDPPTRHMSEANADKPRESDDSGDPPKT